MFDAAYSLVTDRSPIQTFVKCLRWEHMGMWQPALFWSLCTCNALSWMPLIWLEENETMQCSFQLILLFFIKKNSLKAYLYLYLYLCIYRFISISIDQSISKWPKLGWCNITMLVFALLWCHKNMEYKGILLTYECPCCCDIGHGFWRLEKNF